MNLDDILKDKRTTHGDFSETAALSQAIKMLFRRGKNWESMPNDGKESLELLASNIARILHGDASEARHWNHAAGYMRLRGASLEGPIETGIARIAERLRPRPVPHDPDEVA
jgi:hypothetical protein